MNILVLNCGSTSIKSAMVDTLRQKLLLYCTLEELPNDRFELRKMGGPVKLVCEDEVQNQVHLLLEDLLEDHSESVHAVAHRVVHGGSSISEPQRIDGDLLGRIEHSSRFAKRHNPIELAGIHETLRRFKDLPHVVMFDSAFHSTIPEHAFVYPLPKVLNANGEFRRLGFHGLSHEYVAQRSAQFLGKSYGELRIISCHLGGGCSVCAISHGQSVETSMGYTPLDGLIMPTRCGDLDPGVLLLLLERGKCTEKELNYLLSREGGLQSFTGSSGDMRDILEGVETGDSSCVLALEAFCYRVKKYIGAYCAVMGGVDVILFTAGIGENCAEVRRKATEGLEYLGAIIDKDVNRRAVLSAEVPVVKFSTNDSQVDVLAVKTDEQLWMALHANAFLRGAKETRLEA